DRVGGVLSWYDRDAGAVTAQPELLGDIVLARKDLGVSYHLAVTVDDAYQGVTLVTRGADLFAATHAHRVLQALLDLPVPEYRHHRLITDAAGNRLATRGGAMTLRRLREQGWTPDNVRKAVAETA
ncbi:MAG: glutamate--tRNA ligase family protein, partial [Proteobacteria bacterium]|nr:glutamate--tRNA ligase family protein [Pseudomonadota bacterium]